MQSHAPEDGAEQADQTDGNQRPDEVPAVA
jgi:hypothetical protein